MARKNKKIIVQNKQKRNIGRKISINEKLFEAFVSNTPLTSISESMLTTLINTRRYLITNQGQLLMDLYCTSGLVSKYIDMPVDDAFSSGFTINTNEVDGDEVAQVVKKMVTSGDIQELKDALIWSRLFGGGGIAIITNHNYEKSFDINQLSESDELEFKAFSKWDLTQQTSNLMYNDFDFANFNNAKFNYFGLPVARSRLILIKGQRAPTQKMQQTGGWGLSAVEQVLTHINQFIKMNDLIFEIISEFKVDVLSLDSLNDTLIDEPEILRARAEEIALIKNNKGMLVIDAKDKFDSRNLTFSGIPEIMSKNENHLSAMMKIPATRFWGISASGFSSGNEDLEAYNIMLMSYVHSKALPVLTRMVEMRFKQVLGYVPKDLSIEFNPLREMTVTDKELVKTNQFNRISEMHDKGIITDEEFINEIESKKL